MSVNELPCGCCEGVHVVTPEPVANRPGLPALRYRAGTHASFLSTMLARLSDRGFPGLAGLTARDRDDPAIALVDAWAVVADVLTFYQERIANEGFLRTAVERRSVVELARLVGYEPRPGVAASTHLAFELERDHDEVVPLGTKAQSVPAPGQLPQVYETSEPLAARAAFNRLQVRMTRPQAITKGNADGIRDMWLDGTATRLQPNDALAIVVGEGADAAGYLRFVDAVTEDYDARRTQVTLIGGRRARAAPWVIHRDLLELVDLVATGTAAEVKTHLVAPAVTEQDRSRTDAALRLQQVLRPDVAPLLYKAWANAVVSRRERVRVYALRVKASLFGHNAPRVPAYDEQFQPKPMSKWADWDPAVERAEDPMFLHLDNPYPSVKTGGVVVVQTPRRPRGDFHGLDPRQPITVDVIARSAYGLTAKTTRVAFTEPDKWDPPEAMAELREVVVYAQSEPLDLAEAPITENVCRTDIELAELYEGIDPGRKLVVTGERADLPGVIGVTASELVTVADVRQGPVGEGAGLLPGDANHTFVVLAGRGLRYCYRRDTVTIHGNVVHATHGESRAEVLGSGDAASAHQRFALRSSPLTYVSASTDSGVESTLEVRVNDVRWPRRPWFLDLRPDEPGYVTRADDQQVTAVIGPNGVEGRRYPTGAENVRARYRAGIGRPGNTDAGRITMLIERPVSVREVVNPVPATGGADPEGTDEAREHAPLPIKALGRLVSAVDYADFARTFAGVGKAAADRLVDGRRQVLAVTIAGAAGDLLDARSDVVINLRRALRRFGDPSVTVKVLVAERLVLRLDAAVRIDPDYEWASVEPKVRAALLGAFGFERRGLGDDVAESEVLAVMHAVPGVVSATLAERGFGYGLDGGPLLATLHPARRVVAARARREGDALLPAQHLYLAPELPELLVLTKATP